MEPDRPIPQFEDVYMNYEFAPLVHLAVKAAEWTKAQIAKWPRRAHRAAQADNLLRARHL